MNIMYGGDQYSVGEADVDAIRGAIDEAHASGAARWITVNFGEGRPQPAQLLVGPGIPVSIIPIPSDDGTSDAEEDAEVDSRGTEALDAE
ncbi:hypothetical protein [Agromyces arachidis]|uniref:hypothetical protein n=1 Tax=Agromyces arachidis TaxID=766966 RepID=UPI004056C38E